MLVFIRLVFLTIALSGRYGSAALTAPGKTVIVDGQPYFVPPTVVTTIKASHGQLHFASKSGEELIGFTVIEDSSGSFTPSALDLAVSKYKASDDVFNTGFLDGDNSCITFRTRPPC
jgi:hypothetical protein